MLPQINSWVANININLIANNDIIKDSIVEFYNNWWIASCKELSLTSNKVYYWNELVATNYITNKVIPQYITYSSKYNIYIIIANISTNQYMYTAKLNINWSFTVLNWKTLSRQYNEFTSYNDWTNCIILWWLVSAWTFYINNFTLSDWSFITSWTERNITETDKVAITIINSTKANIIRRRSTNWYTQWQYWTIWDALSFTDMLASVINFWNNRYYLITIIDRS